MDWLRRAAFVVAGVALLNPTDSLADHPQTGVRVGTSYQVVMVDGKWYRVANPVPTTTPGSVVHGQPIHGAPQYVQPTAGQTIVGQTVTGQTRVGQPVVAQRAVTQATPDSTLVSNLGSAARYVVNRDPAAYAHALREAQILARQGTSGHPLGCAPGTSYSGTGYSWSPSPNHCYYGEMPESRLVARACVRGPNGAYFWSAHYR
jgi:hypothetical protein